MGRRREDVEPGHRIGPLERRRRAKVATIDRQRLVERVGGEMRGEGVGQAKDRGELRAEQAGAEYPHLRRGAGARGCANAGAAIVGEIALQLDDVVGELVRVAVQVAAQCLCDTLVRSRRASQPKVDPPGKQRIERPELFGDDQRRMIGQHDPARTDADRLRRRGDMRDHHRGRGGGDPLHAVMLRHPIAVISVCLCVPCKVRGVRERLRHRAGVGDGDEIEQRITCHVVQDGGVML